jgi:hypothetical protein
MRTEHQLLEHADSNTVSHSHPTQGLDVDAGGIKRLEGIG